MTHPHTNKRHVMIATRRWILGCKKKFGTARSQVNYLRLVHTYLTAKREYLNNA